MLIKKVFIEKKPFNLTALLSSKPYVYPALRECVFNICFKSNAYRTNNKVSGSRRQLFALPTTGIIPYKKVCEEENVLLIAIFTVVCHSLNYIFSKGGTLIKTKNLLLNNASKNEYYFFDG